MVITCLKGQMWVMTLTIFVLKQTPTILMPQKFKWETFMLLLVRSCRKCTVKLTLAESIQ